MLIFVQRDSDVCVCPTAHINNYKKAFYELDCERNQKVYVEVFLTWEIFLSCCSIVKNYGEMFFFQFYFAVMPSNRNQASLENRISVENQHRVRAAKIIANTNDF